ncbi:MurR/RpiR family transcriptional regulator [Paenibacillus sp. GCM10023252]|uniref:MurR/RpiR family transcriptional regulator n=1 Tax=Paenibacillus sp. GCM10023252 TaxID=3252649 RepID=UPI00361B215A
MSSRILSSSVVAAIESHYPTLTKSEQKVAGVVLQRTEEVIYFSVTDLADTAEVGDTTVLRFCRTIGFKSYQEFKLALAKEASRPSEDPARSRQSGFVEQIYANSLQVIEKSRSLLDTETLHEVIHRFSEGKSIHFFGAGSSGVSALEAKARFLRIGRRVESGGDTHFQAMNAATLTEHDIAIGISVSGSTKDTIDCCQTAKSNGATVIAITNYARSPLAKLADYVLLTGGMEAPLEGGSLGAKISQLLLIDMICTGVALKDQEHSVTMKEKTARSVLNKIY